MTRHSAEQLAKRQLTEGLTGAAGLATYEPGDPKLRLSDLYPDGLPDNLER